MIAAGRNIGKRSWYIAKPTAEELYNLNTKILVFCNNPNMVTKWNRWESKLKISILKKVFLSVLCFCFVLFCFSMLWLLFVLFLGDVGVFLASYTRPHARRLSLFFELDKFLTVDQYLCFVSFPVWAVGRKTEGADCRAEKDWRCNQVKLNSRITELITEPRRSFTHKTLYKNAYLLQATKWSKPKLIALHIPIKPIVSFLCHARRV